MIGQLTSHLWQSTWFAVAVALLTLVFRGNRAQVRYGLWLCASLKFLVPFALFIGLGAQLAPRQVTAPVVPLAVERIALSFAEPVSFAAQAPPVRDWKPFAFAAAWLCGLASIAFLRMRGWRRVRAALRASKPLHIPAAVQIRSAPGLLEPGVVGLLRPVLLLPEGIVERLTPSQLEAVLAHELCHVRRRDNLWAAVQMVVEAAFWFHPLVWWIGARMVEERERACDEAVLSLGNEPHTYAEAILGVCKLYVESPLACVSGVTGANLKQRIEAIMNNRIGLGLNATRKLLLAGAGVAALAAPVILGLLIGAAHAPVLRAQPPVMPVPPVHSASPAPQPLPVAAAPQRATLPSTPAPQTGRMLALLFDCDSMTSDEQAQARNAAAKYVQTKMEPGDVMSVMVETDGKLAVAQDFTADPAVLLAAISSVNGPSGSSESSRVATLEQAARMLGAIPGKKALMYFSSGTAQLDPAPVQQAIRTAQVANVAFYPIDVNANAMNRILTRYGKPDQVEDREAGAQIWRYNYLESFHSRVEFAFLGQKGHSAVRILWPPPVIFPGVYAEFQTYPAGEPQTLSASLEGFTGRVDITAEVRRILNNGDTRVAANVRDVANIPHPDGRVFAYFTLDAGSYIANVVLSQRETGKNFTETIRFEVK